MDENNEQGNCMRIMRLDIDASELFSFSALESPQPLNEGECTSS